jgi:hypothetical protein
MKRTTVNFVVDAVAFVAFSFLAATGAIIHFVLPAGSGHFETLWGMDRHQWGEIHFWIAATMAVTVVTHLLLHWRWLVTTIRGGSPTNASARVLLAVAVVALVVGVALSPFFATVQSKDGVPPHKRQFGEHSEGPAHEITGSMTLDEVERNTGVSAATILKELGLPRDVPTDERLGRLRKQYGFEMEAVRNAVRKNLESRGNAP